jgi:transcriptional antiterminator NusG
MDNNDLENELKKPEEDDVNSIDESQNYELDSDGDQSIEDEVASLLKHPHPDSKWYVVRTQSNRENRVRKTVEKRVVTMGLEDKIFRVLVPTELVSEIRRGFKRVVEKKLYPGYVIVQMIFDDETHYMLKTTPGVGDVAGSMTELEVERILLRSAQAKDKPKPKVAYHKGQTIRVKEGPFKDCKGVVDEVNEQKGSIKVKIDIFGRQTGVELGYWQVESVPDEHNFCR